MTEGYEDEEREQPPPPEPPVDQDTFDNYADQEEPPAGRSLEPAHDAEVDGLEDEKAYVDYEEAASDYAEKYTEELGEEHPARGSDEEKALHEAQDQLDERGLHADATRFEDMDEEELDQHRDEVDRELRRLRDGERGTGRSAGH